MSVWIILVVAQIALPPSLGHAQSKLERAKAHYEQGEAYFQAKTYQEAITEYQAAFALVPRAGLLFNIGLCHENLGNLKEALDFYRRYLKKGKNNPKASEARARAAALEKQLAEREKQSTLRKYAQQKVEAGRAALAAGNAELALQNFQEAEKLVNDPEIVFEIAEAYRAARNWLLAEEEYRRYIRIAPQADRRELAAKWAQECADARAAGKPTDNNSKPSGSNNVLAPPVQGSKLESSPKNVLSPSLGPTIVAFSVAGLAGTAGIIFGLQANRIERELGDAADEGGPPLDTGDSRFEEGRRKAFRANLSFAAAGISTAVGAYFLYRWNSQRKGSKESASGSTLVVVPSVSPKASSVQLEFQF